MEIKINGAEIKELAVHTDDRGLLMEFLRNDDPIFQSFGQTYMTLVVAGVAKGWHYHKMQDDHFVCVGGTALVVLSDQREDSPTKGVTQEFILSAPELEGNHWLVKIPKGVFHGFAAYNCEAAKIVNIPTKAYNYQEPDEYRIAWNSPEVGYKWPEQIVRGG